MKFYMTPGSCSTSIHIILEELDQVFEVYIVNLPAGDHFKPDYVAINPKSTIPALVRKNGSTLTEVPAIAYWLARTHPRAKLWPEAPDNEARALEVIAYVVDTIHGQGFARIFSTKTFARNPDEHQGVRQLGQDIIVKGFEILDKAIAGKQAEFFYRRSNSLLCRILGRQNQHFDASGTRRPLPPHADTPSGASRPAGGRL